MELIAKLDTLRCAAVKFKDILENFIVEIIRKLWEKALAEYLNIDNVI